MMERNIKPRSSQKEVDEGICDSIDNAGGGKPSSDPLLPREASEPKCVEEIRQEDRILFEDPNLLIINKPEDVRMNGDFNVTVEKLIHYWRPNLRGIDLKWIHQLDYATSGVLCVGLDQASTMEACKLFEFRKAKKKYIALLEGHLHSDSFPEVDISGSEVYPLHGKSAGPQQTMKGKKRPAPGLQYRPPASFFQEHKQQLRKQYPNWSSADLHGNTEKAAPSPDEARVLGGKWRDVRGDTAFVRKYLEASEKDQRRAETALEEAKKREQSRPQIFRVKGDAPDTFWIDAPLEEVPGDFRMRAAGAGRASLTRVAVLARGRLLLPPPPSPASGGGGGNGGGGEGVGANGNGGGGEGGGGEGRPVTRAALAPATGRRHQLRVHCRLAGHPIVGDATYTGDMQTPRMMLHSQSLELPFEEGKGPGRTIGVATQDPFTSYFLQEQI